MKITVMLIHAAHDLNTIYLPMQTLYTQNSCDALIVLA